MQSRKSTLITQEKSPRVSEEAPKSLKHRGEEVGAGGAHPGLPRVEDRPPAVQDVHRLQRGRGGGEALEKERVGGEEAVEHPEQEQQRQQDRLCSRFHRASKVAKCASSRRQALGDEGPQLLRPSPPRSHPACSASARSSAATALGQFRRTAVDPRHQPLLREAVPAQRLPALEHPAAVSGEVPVQALDQGVRGDVLLVEGHVVVPRDDEETGIRAAFARKEEVVIRAFEIAGQLQQDLEVDDVVDVDQPFDPLPEDLRGRLADERDQRVEGAPVLAVAPVRDLLHVGAPARGSRSWPGCPWPCRARGGRRPRAPFPNSRRSASTRSIRL